MSEAQGATVKFGGDASGAVAASQEAAKAVQQAVGGMSQHMASANSVAEKMQGTFSRVMGAMGATGGSAMSLAGGLLGLGAAAVVANFGIEKIGQTVRAAIWGTSEATEEVVRFGIALGISATKASILAFALDDAFVSMGEYQGMVKGLGRNLKTNEEAMNAMGVVTRDAAGAMRPTNDLIKEGARVLLTYKAGMDQTIAATKIFGRGADVGLVLRAASADFKKAEEDARALGMVLSKESVEANEAFKKSMDNVGDMFTAMGRAVGVVLLPVLSKLGDWLTSVGPMAVTILRGAFGGLTSTFWVFSTAVTAVWEVLDALIYTIAEPLMAAGLAFSRLITGDLSGAAAALAAWPAKIREKWLSAFTEIGSSAKNTGKQVWDAFADGTEADPAKGGTKTANSPKDTGAAELERARNAAALAVRKEGVAAAMRALEQAHNDELLADEQFYAAKVSMEQASLDMEAGGKRAEIAALNAKKGLEENQSLAKQAGLLAQIARLNGELVVIAMKRTDAAVQGARAVEGAEQKRSRALEKERISHERAMAEIDMQAAEEELRVQREYGLLEEGEEQRRQTSLENMRHGFVQRELEQKLTLAANDAAERVRINNAIEAEARSHANRLTKIGNDAGVKAYEPIEKLQAEMQSRFQTGLDSMFDRTKTFGRKMKDLWSSFAALFIQTMVTQPLARWAAAETMKLAMSTTVGQALMAMAGITTAANVAAKTAEVAVAVPANAAIAASGAAAAVAPTPFVGPVLAVAAFAAIMAMVMGARSVASARGGYDIPAGVNPMTQLHEREMVLPAKHADVIRDMSNGGGGGGPAIQVHLNVQALDGASVKRVLVDNHSAVAAGIVAALRNNSLTRGNLR